jgi:DNA-directed RNA polymerase specialized sigma24 family protein
MTEPDADLIPRRHLLLGISELPPRYQMVFLVRELGRASWAEIAALLRVSKARARQIFKDAEAKLERLV